MKGTKNKYANSELFRKFHMDTFRCGGIVCSECAFYPATKSDLHCGAVMLRAFMAKLSGADEVPTCGTVTDEELIEFIRNNPSRNG